MQPNMGLLGKEVVLYSSSASKQFAGIHKECYPTETMKPLTCQASVTLYQQPESASGGLVIVLPDGVSEQLPSRGMVLMSGTLNERPFQAAFEPNGAGSHWAWLSPDLVQSLGLVDGAKMHLVLEPQKVWPEPAVPADIAAALESDPDAMAIWQDITAAARWDWIRWILAAKQEETRKKRIVVGCSKLRSGKRRPCCFDRSACTLTIVNKEKEF